MKQRILYFLIVFFFLGIQVDLYAQGKDSKQRHLTAEERIDKQVQVVANSLMLDDETSEKFRPLYERYLKEFRGLTTQGMRFDFNKDKLSRGKNISDEQIEQLIQQRFVKCREVLSLREKYYYEFKKVLTPRQIMKMYSIERNFGKKVQGELERRYKNKIKR